MQTEFSGVKGMNRAGFRNRILAALGDEQMEVVCSLLHKVPLKAGAVLSEPHGRIGTALFVEQGIISVIASSTTGREMEIGVIGREGMMGAELLLEDPRSPFRSIVQVEGEAWAIGSDALVGACQGHSALGSLVSRYSRTLAIQSGFTALANGRYKLEQRLARWLLMVDDRMDGSRISLTHEFLAVLLGVHRPGITLALQMLEGRGFIKSLRGEVHIRDRRGLLDFTEGAYGSPEAEYARIMGFAI